ncbi:hypothetical protein EV561_10195 [Rhizobium sp. BK376]|nr:hypothetical protein EV561_10195 [Rhizobium sp. BK376]
MRIRIMSAVLALTLSGSVGFSAAEAMPLPGVEMPRSPLLHSVDYTCGDGMHFTNQGCVVDEKPAAPVAKAKPKPHVQKKKPHPHHKHPPQ